MFFEGISTSFLWHKRFVWVCLKIGYIPNYSHFIGIMIIHQWVIRGLAHFQTYPYGKMQKLSVAKVHPLQLRHDPLIANEWKKHFGAEVPGLIPGVWPWDELITNVNEFT